MNRTFFLILAACFALNACGNGAEQKKAEEQRNKALYNATKQQLDKARAVNDAVQAQKDAMDKAIDEQSQ